MVGRELPAANVDVAKVGPGFVKIKLSKLGGTDQDLNRSQQEKVGKS